MVHTRIHITHAQYESHKFVWIFEWGGGRKNLIYKMENEEDEVEND